MSALTPLQKACVEHNPMEDHGGLIDGYQFGTGSGEVEYRTGDRWQQYTASELDWIARGIREATAKLTPENLDAFVKHEVTEALAIYEETRKQECDPQYSFDRLLEHLTQYKGV